MVKLIESLIRALMFLTGVLGNNWLAIRSLPRTKSAIRTNEILFINLAVSDLITNYLVDLPDTMADFTGSWFMGETYCKVFSFCSDLSKTSSIFTTFFISAFWHQKLVGSLKRGGGPVLMDSLCLVACLLAGSWTVAMVFSIPHFFIAKVERINESGKASCVDFFPDITAEQTYTIIYLTVANAFPLAGTLTVSVHIVVTLLQNHRRIRGHSADHPKKIASQRSGEKINVDAIPKTRPSSTDTTQGLGVNCHGLRVKQVNLPKLAEISVKHSSRIQVRAAKSVVAVASVFLVCWLTHILLRLTNNFHVSPIVLEVASYIAASYTSIIPYIFLHGVKKLSCSCCQ